MAHSLSAQAVTQMEMEDDFQPVPPKVLLEAVQAGADADTVKELIEGLTVEEIAEHAMCGRTALHFAIDRDGEVFKAVLDGMDTVGLCARDRNGFDVLHYLLKHSKREAVMQIAERRDWEVVLAHRYDPAARMATLLMGSLAGDKEVVDKVINALERGSCLALDVRSEFLTAALQCRHDSNYVINLCLERGPTMAERLGGQSRLRFVGLAARHKDLAMLQKLHELVPLMDDGSGMRASVEEYSKAVTLAAANVTDNVACMEYLIEEGGIDSLTSCRPIIFRWLKTEEALELVLARAPHLLTAACERGVLWSVLLSLPHNVAEYLIGQVLDLVEPSVIMETLLVKERSGLSGSWRCKLGRLFREVPETQSGQRWKCLMSAVTQGHYDDVELLLSLCTQADLALRNKDGERACDIAARDMGFPQDLRCRLAVVTKGAY